ncbi:MAG: hypothetical protein IKW67_01575 [Alphaproteobacteria bacterium]|nr:hypothetical protein [Alphaproteobacteria bacterium]
MSFTQENKLNVQKKSTKPEKILTCDGCEKNCTLSARQCMVGEFTYRYVPKIGNTDIFSYIDENGNLQHSFSPKVQFTSEELAIERAQIISKLCDNYKGKTK